MRALPAGSRWAHQPVRWGEWVRDRFWSIPVALIVAGVLIGVVVSRPELLGLSEDWGFGNLARTSTADALLQVMASSMLTFVGVVFAITLVALELASPQLSPRVLRTFVRSPVTKTAFGVFLASFAFALTALAFDNVDSAAAASRTVVVSIAMLALSVAVFLVYVTATMRLLEVGWVITAVAHEARATITGRSRRGELRRRGRAGARRGATARPAAVDGHQRIQGCPGHDPRVDRSRLVRRPPSTGA